MLEDVDNRALGAVRFTDVVTSARLEGPIGVEAAGIATVRNRSGLYVIVKAPQLAAHIAAFQAVPAAPALGAAAVLLTVRPRRRDFLPRQVRLSLPRDPDPAHALAADSLFQPIDVPLFRAPGARAEAGWASVRVSVRAPAGGPGLANVYLRVLRTRDAVVLGRGLTDHRGEGVVFVAGLPLVNWNEGEGEVSTSEVDVTLEGFRDSAAPSVPDPDRFEARLAGLPRAAVPLRLATGRELVAALELPLA
jgi:hypothetical protein